ncbi:MAG: hypothetical protein AAF335_00850 [Bacteroidota bacterium]
MALYDIFGKKRCRPVYEAQEKRNPDTLLEYKWSALSSLLYIGLSIYTFWTTTKYPAMSYATTAMFVVTGFSSFFFWASMRYTMQKLDVGSYSSMLHWPGFYFLSAFFPESDFAIMLVFVAISALLILYIFWVGIERIGKIRLFINIFSVTFSTLTCMVLIYLYGLDISVSYFYGGLLFFALGVYAKFADSLRFSFRIVQQKGTALFHLLTATAAFFLFQSAQ